MRVHTLPRELSWLENSLESRERPQQIVSEFETGGTMVRDFGDRNLRSFRIDPALLSRSSKLLEDFDAFVEHVQLRRQPFYVVLPEERAIKYAVCQPPLPDGAVRTFLYPVLEGAGAPDEIFVGGIARRGVFILHPKANVLTDDQWSAVATTDGLIKVGSCNMYRVETLAPVAKTAIQIDPIGTVSDYGCEATAQLHPFTGGVSPGDLTHFYGAATVKGFGQYTLEAEFMVSEVGPVVEGPFSTVVTLDAARWVDLLVAAPLTQPVQWGRVRITRSESGSAIYHVGALGLIPGDFTEVHRPTLAPPLLELNTAPDAGQLVHASGTGLPVTRVTLADRAVSWRLTSPGHHEPRSLEMIEEPVR